MGRETVKKLQDLRFAAQQAGTDIEVPENCINKGEEGRAAAGRVLSAQRAGQ
jgi:hypothetical protein